MATSSRKINLLPSLIDRFWEGSPEIGRKSSAEDSWTLSMLLESIRRDLEDLLNTRAEMLEKIPPEFTETRQSLLTYGLPELVSFNRHNSEDQRRLVQLIENSIRLFEPRLQRIKVIMHAPNENKPQEKRLLFTIEGFLFIEPAPERVMFDSELELSTGEYRIQGVR